MIRSVAGGAKIYLQIKSFEQSRKSWNNFSMLRRYLNICKLNPVISISIPVCVCLQMRVENPKCFYLFDLKDSSRIIQVWRYKDTSRPIRQSGLRKKEFYGDASVVGAFNHITFSYAILINVYVFKSNFQF